MATFKAGGGAAAEAAEPAKGRFRGASVLGAVDGVVKSGGAGGAEHSFSEEEKVRKGRELGGGRS